MHERIAHGAKAAGEIARILFGCEWRHGIKQTIAGNLSFQPLIPSAATSWTGFLNALLFAVLSIAAFDSVA